MSRANLRQYLYRKKPDDFYALFDGFAFGMVDLPANLPMATYCQTSLPKRYFLTL